MFNTNLDYYICEYIMRKDMQGNFQECSPVWKRILRLLEFCALKKETGDGTIYLSCVPCEMMFRNRHEEEASPLWPSRSPGSS